MHPISQLSVAARRLLAYLALHGEPVARSLAASALWPDVPDDLARSNLRRALWQLPAGWIAPMGDEISLDAAVDLPEVHRIATRALQGQPLTLEEIHALSEDILPGWHDEWLTAAQDRFRLLRVQALEAACRTMADQGQYALATQAGSAALSAEPLSESAAEALIRAHLAQRNRYQAVQCFRTLAARLEQELGVEPDARLVECLGSLADGRPSTH